jgi:hypothetical protein
VVALGDPAALVAAAAPVAAVGDPAAAPVAALVAAAALVVAAAALSRVNADVCLSITTAISTLAARDMHRSTHPLVCSPPDSDHTCPHTVQCVRSRFSDFHS